MKAAEATVMVRRRADGVPEIVRRRPRRLPSLESWIPSLALGFIALALYVGALAPAALIVLLAAACTAVDAFRSRRAPAPPAVDGAHVVPLSAAQR